MKRQSWMQVALALVVVVAVGCASGGSAGVATPAAAPDYTNEVAENGLLTPRALLARFVDAIGGEDALRSHTSLTAKGKFSLAAMGVEGDLVLRSAAPNKMIMNIEMGGMGSMVTGYNGEIGWSENPMTGSLILEGGALELAAQQAAFYGPLDYDTLFPTQETVEKTEFAGESAYKVRLVTPSGGEQFQYFSEATGLMIGQEGMQDQGMGEQHVVAVISDYRDFGGILTAAKTTANVMGMEITQTVEEVVYDNVDASAFEPSDAIKALID